MLVSLFSLQCMVFVTVTGAILAANAWAIRRDRLIEQRIRGLSTPPDRRRNEASGWLSVLGGKLPWLTESLLASRAKQRPQLQTRMIEAGIYAPWATSAFVAIRCVLVLALPAACLATAGFGWLSPSLALLIGSGGGVAGILAPHLWLQRRRARRHSALRRGLPDFLDLVVVCLAGGLSMPAALRKVTEELSLAHPELTGELLIVLREMELGRALDHSLQQLAARTGLEELRTLCSFAHQTSKFGTAITDALQQMAESLRIHREQRAEEQAQKAAVKVLFPTMLFIFPTVFVVLAGPAAIQIKEGLTVNENEASPMKNE